VREGCMGGLAVVNCRFIQSLEGKKNQGVSERRKKTEEQKQAN